MSLTAEQTPAVIAAADLAELRLTLENKFGVSLKPVVAAISALSQRSWKSIDDLIDVSCLPHRTILDLVNILSEFVERKGNALRLNKNASKALVTTFGDIIPCLENHDGEKKPEIPPLSEIISHAPRFDFNLDHVSATPDTCARRAFWLNQNFYLHNQDVLFLGDHDLTSIALGLLARESRIAVVDVDERVLEYINSECRRRGLRIETYFADLRLALPKSLESRFALVITDPPYTPLGMRLFLSRAIEALAQGSWNRIVACYGYTPLSPMLGLEVQRELMSLNVVYEAILPKFNRYNRAGAIGKSSGLYVFQPTRLSLPAASNPPENPNIYSHGVASSDAISFLPTENAVVRFTAICGRTSDQQVTLVGEDFSKSVLPNAQRMSLRKFVTVLRSPASSAPFGNRVLLVNLWPYFDLIASRLVLLSKFELLGIIGSAKALSEIVRVQEEPDLRRLFRLHYERVKIERIDDKRSMALLKKRESKPADNIDFVLQQLLMKRQALLINAWREALIDVASQSGKSLSKNAAREYIRQTDSGNLYSKAFVFDLSKEALRNLIRDITETVHLLESDSQRIPA